MVKLIGCVLFSVIPLLGGNFQIFEGTEESPTVEKIKVVFLAEKAENT
jgi:hypothetical protein